jgi:hypothetical protein
MVMYGTVAALCSSWLELAELLRMATSAWIKLEDHTWVLFASVCCLPNCIICKSVLPAQLYYFCVLSTQMYYLQVCALCPTVLFVCSVCPTVLFASVFCLPNCITCKCVLPVQLPVLFRKFRTPSIPGTASMIRSLQGRVTIFRSLKMRTL